MDSLLISLATALKAFALSESTQGQDHIRPLHQHIVQKLVIEGGFRPEHLTPRPPFVITNESRGGIASSLYSDTPMAPQEQTILGGLKTKDVDVVLSQRLLGPCLAVSVKGTTKAFRNLTNRMEEAAGDCTNLHMSYPALVYGFLHVIRANRPSDAAAPNDIAILDDGSVVVSIVRYHDAMARITGRTDLRNDVSRYEAVGMLFVNPSGTMAGTICPDYPYANSKLAFDGFFFVPVRLLRSEICLLSAKA